MALSAFDLYSVGIGPSSSHTVGPMRAARRFASTLDGQRVGRVRAELFGSLGATGHGHGSAKAVVLGLLGEDPATVDTDTADERVAQIRRAGRLRLAGGATVAFDADIVLHRRRSLPEHPNGMRFHAWDPDGRPVSQRTYFSVGGGFVVGDTGIVPDTTTVPHPFSTGGELLALCRDLDLPVSAVMYANERAWRPAADTRAHLLHLWSVMQACVARGCAREGVLPGGLRVPRRAPALYRDLKADEGTRDPLRVLDWVNLFALAVNEENASGGRIVTAPTNGAAGIIPAVLHYYTRFVPGATDDGVARFLLTAAAIGILIKGNASISGAEVGCQGEVGSACAMAAAGLCEVLGGTPAQVENAAEIGLEHNLGLTCDPVGGLVQIPCIERNAIASVKAINAARLALNGDGSHKVTLDKAIRTMRDTGRDMSVKYKETARGGLAVTVIEC
ncbi:L-serine ammonia-lyase [Dactylosporangium aurantiacum]|uniref:L-serine dehydratase n=1 Tax=Dactylosporangium aurantiacum TaxID=35754 RepID=A0A9Q9MHI1_9ACTN|nr:L-serine ammonia-lyase [Dactylosporangium aurantiacum]MDG6101510.1 L-serine ammonia-lyase [Dactylosporangium aurantiacum]UWZ52646.1 L-serine ammonia-lyase [Dactylosporangium aurantiacum]